MRSTLTNISLGGIIVTKYHMKDSLTKLTSPLYPRRNKMEVGVNATKKMKILLRKTHLYGIN